MSGAFNNLEATETTVSAAQDISFITRTAAITIINDSDTDDLTVALKTSGSDTLTVKRKEQITFDYATTGITLNKATSGNVAVRVWGFR